MGDGTTAAWAYKIKPLSFICVNANIVIIIQKLSIDIVLNVYVS